MLNSFIWGVVLSLGSITSSFAGTWEDELPVIAQSQAQVLFFGDSHSSDFHKNAFRELFKALKQNSNAWNCIAMEMDPVWVQKPVEQVEKGTLPHAELASAIFGSVPESIRSSYDHEFFKEYVERFLPESFFETLSSTNARFLPSIFLRQSTTFVGSRRFQTSCKAKSQRTSSGTNVTVCSSLSGTVRCRTGLLDS